MAVAFALPALDGLDLLSPPTPASAFNLKLQPFLPLPFLWLSCPACRRRVRRPCTRGMGGPRHPCNHARSFKAMPATAKTHHPVGRSFLCLAPAKEPQAWPRCSTVFSCCRSHEADGVWIWWH